MEISKIKEFDLEEKLVLSEKLNYTHLSEI
jgi:hypothetical protein